jgi:hypothetical protein
MPTLGNKRVATLDGKWYTSLRVHNGLCRLWIMITARVWGMKGKNAR